MSDTIIHSNKYGKIVINKSVIAGTVTDVVDETRGVRMARLAELFPKRSANVEVDFDVDGTPNIKCYVVIRFGTSISGATYTIISEIKNRVMTLIGREPAGVEVQVIGIKSKKLTRRDIKVKRRYNSYGGH